MTADEKKRLAMKVLLKKIYILLTKPIPQRGTAMAAIDYYLREVGEKMDLCDESHIDDIGVDPRTSSILDDHLGIWCIGQLRSVTREDLDQCPVIGSETIQHLVACMDRHGIKHRLSSRDVFSSSGEDDALESDPLAPLLGEWLGSAAAEA